jgi:exonuclease SbcC
MILKSLKLKNIRSYEDTSIDFPVGTMLFEGDIGSGKSTILLALEFALFGLGDQKGAGLLRMGASAGSVTLQFEVDGQEFEVHRSLERKRSTVQQGEGYIKSAEGVKHLSASEIKPEILDILTFNEPPDPKAQSVIYRYAVYTPQEEMKAILWARADARLQTLRKAFRIEDYRVAADNASNAAKLISKKIDFLEGQVSDIDEKRKQLQQRKESIEENQRILETQMKEQDRLQAKLNATKDELKTLRESEKRLKKAEAEIPLLTKQITEKNEQVERLTSDMDELNQEIAAKLQPDIDALRKIKKPTEKDLETLNKEVQNLEEKEKELRRIEITIEAKIKDYRDVEQNKICPTCDRPADPKEFKAKIETKIEEKEKASTAVSECEKQRGNTEELIKELEKFNEAQEKLDDLNQRLQKDKERINKNNKEIKTLLAERDELQKNLDTATLEFKKLENVSKRIDELNESADCLQTELNKVADKISSAKTMIQELKDVIKSLGDEIQAKEGQKKLSEEMNQYHIWLKDYFVPTLDNIEKHIMITINQEFNHHFQRWFNLLVEDPGKDARVDEDFTPIIEQDGYEQLVDFLSGGEKTSVALAYRLALNTIVQKVSAGMKSNLLILDEPTDGFSKEQLFKVREILNELKCPQVIMVSHERELESFADQVFRVEKREGVSEIKTVSG